MATIKGGVACWVPLLITGKETDPEWLAHNNQVLHLIDVSNIYQCSVNCQSGFQEAGSLWSTWRVIWLYDLSRYLKN